MGLLLCLCSIRDGCYEWRCFTLSLLLLLWFASKLLPFEFENLKQQDASSYEWLYMLLSFRIFHVLHQRKLKVQVTTMETLYARALHGCNQAQLYTVIQVWVQFNLMYIYGESVAGMFSTNTAPHLASYKPNHSDTVVGLRLSSYAAILIFFFNASRPPPSCFFWQLDKRSSTVVYRGIMGYHYFFFVYRSSMQKANASQICTWEMNVSFFCLSTILLLHFSVLEFWTFNLEQYLLLHILFVTSTFFVSSGWEAAPLQLVHRDSGG